MKSRNSCQRYKPSLKTTVFRTTLKDTLEVAKVIDDLKATKRTQDRERFDLETQLDKWQRGNKRLREQLALSQTGLQRVPRQSMD